MEPCPFCGNANTPVSLSDDDLKLFWISCGVWGAGCRTRGPLADSQAEAVEAWNRRSLPQGEEASVLPPISPDDVKLIRDCSDWLDDWYKGRARPDSFSTKLDALADKLASRSSSPAVPSDTEPTIAGMPVRVRDDVPPDEIQCWQNGRCVFRLRNVQGNEMLAVPTPAPPTRDKDNGN